MYSYDYRVLQKVLCVSSILRLSSASPCENRFQRNFLLVDLCIDMLDKRRGGERERDTGRGVNTSSSNPPRNSLFSAQRGRSHFSALEHQFLSPSKLSSSCRKLVIFSIPLASFLFCFLLLYLFFFSSFFLREK